jgi:hypothetical protein
MRFEALLAALIIFADMPGAARAELMASQPKFSAAESQTINRNELLRAIVGSDPWLVRRILDVMEQMHDPARRNEAPASYGLNAARDPDLAGAARTAAGSVEWLELLRRARAEKEAQGKAPATENGRSAEGSVELIEMMKRARAAKEGGKAR